ncbi:hypothetical protein RRG08_063459 [Elysia crispata]|uniref:C2H2-type domain-containing protein n=1 Tax=Elysia crispata TaxID=231223 RepID=A0AAE1AA45_9GAST|nr:hypothetical protein RRG08_063459 [Elysia crispata]
MLEGLHFPGLRLGSPLLLRPPALAAPGSHEVPTSAAAAAARQPCQPANQASHPSKASKPLWNPALDLTLPSAHSSPRKGDTAESLPLVTSNLHPGTAVTLTSSPMSSPGVATTMEANQKEETPSLPNCLSNARSTSPHSLDKRNEAPILSAVDPASAPTLSTEITRKKRRESGGPRCSSPKQTKRPSHRQEQPISDKRERTKSPEGKIVEDLQTSPRQNSHPFVGDVRGVAGIGCVTTDSQSYQNFHHQRRLALLASNLLQMGSQGHCNLLGHHSHPHLLPPQLQHHHPSHQVPPCTPGGLQHHPGLSFNNALAIAKSREVLERLSSSSAFSNSSSSSSTACEQHRRHHNTPHHHHPQRHPHIEPLHSSHAIQTPQSQQPKNCRKESHPVISCSSSSSSSSSLAFLPHLPKAEKLHPPHSLAIQNALVLAQSRALMERVSAGHILSAPGLNIDPLLPSHPHHHPAQPGILSPHGGSAPVGPGSLVGMGVAGINGGAPGGGSYGRKLFPCPQCRYTTDRRNNLKRHMLTMHQTSSKMLECCGILFSTKASLREHAMIFHYHGYTCYFCGRRFCRKALLKRHLSVHNGQKDFVCTICDYATSHKSNLERHRKVHSRQEGNDGKDREEEEMMDRSDEFRTRYHDDMKSNGSEAVSHDDVSEDELSVGSDYQDDIDVEIDVHND